MDVIIPLQSSLVPTLPDMSHDGAEYELALSSTQKSTVVASGKNVQTKLQQAMSHQPFSRNLPTISAFADEVEVMNSLQQPKKIVIIGSDRHSYPFLCKSEDDMRKDACAMRFSAMINHLLQANQQTRQRDLHIRTYAVVPLSEQCGVIEWVGSTTGIRQILKNQYAERGINIWEPLSEFQAPTEPHAEGNQSLVLSQQECFTQEILPMFRPIFHEWFVEMFPSPERWLLSRTAFTRTAAVMSIVGFILGLGDRHFENIKLDDKSGEVVHIDFGFLFDVGKQLLEHPEQVPFRLTQNMVDAMGATGYEGTFRKTCEMTLRLLREHCDVLMSALEPLVYEPSMDWPRFDEHSSQPSGSGSGPAHLPRRARHALAIVRKKLQGTLNGEAQQSVEEQVDELIREATDPGRLVQMYIGWAPYL
ncbi:hypothetical protein FBU59_001879 [Linderina macrospora]|uniref:Uncharacterized protein n=1 Tax=Linderina macrospora TaxID=4868 RepID=A0ACC1JCQ2_9FUNG|nr:hypothetical protein FBU59_001879 [Linderina macrospora]